MRDIKKIKQQKRAETFSGHVSPPRFPWKSSRWGGRRGGIDRHGAVFCFLFLIRHSARLGLVLVGIEVLRKTRNTTCSKQNWAALLLGKNSKIQNSIPPRWRIQVRPDPISAFAAAMYHPVHIVHTSYCVLRLSCWSVEVSCWFYWSSSRNLRLALLCANEASPLFLVSIICI